MAITGCGERVEGHAPCSVLIEHLSSFGVKNDGVDEYGWIDGGFLRDVSHYEVHFDALDKFGGMVTWIVLSSVASLMECLFPRMKLLFRTMWMDGMRNKQTLEDEYAT